MTNVFAVTAGEYSDYHIVAIFSTRERAQTFIKKSGEGMVEEYTLDPSPAISEQELKDLGFSCWGFEMKEDGTLLYEPQYSYFRNFSRFQVRDSFVNGQRITCLSCLVLARTSHAAIKIANEQRPKILALNLWKPYEYEATIGDPDEIV